MMAPLKVSRRYQYSCVLGELFVQKLLRKLPIRVQLPGPQDECALCWPEIVQR